MRVYALFDPTAGTGLSILSFLNAMNVLVSGQQQERVYTHIYDLLALSHPERIFRRDLAAMRVYHNEVNPSTGLRRELIQFILGVFQREEATTMDYLSREDFDAVVKSAKWSCHFVVAAFPILLAQLEIIHAENTVKRRMSRRRSSLNRTSKSEL